IREREIDSFDWVDEPCSNRRRRYFVLGRITRPIPRVRRSCERLRCKGLHTFLNLDRAVDRKILVCLPESTRPLNGGSDKTLIRPQAERDFFRVLRQETRARLQIFRLTKSAGFKRHCGADRVAIALDSAQAKAD